MCSVCVMITICVFQNQQDRVLSIGGRANPLTHAVCAALLAPLPLHIKQNGGIEQTLGAGVWVIVIICGVEVLIVMKITHHTVTPRHLLKQAIGMLYLNSQKCVTA